MTREASKWGPRLLILLVLASAYLLTLLPGPGVHGDTAKFQFVGKVLGTPHVTGYPTYTVLNHLFTRYFPFGSLAFKANLLSALFSVGACLVLFEILALLQVSRAIAAAVSILFGLTPTVWSQSVIAEVYTLHLLFLTSVIYFFLRWHLSGRRGFLLWGTAVYALSFGNHLTTVVLAPALAYLVLATDRRVAASPRLILFGLAAFAAGALQYGYILWRTLDPSTPYLEMSLSDWSTTLWFLKGAQFQSLMFQFGLRELIIQRLTRFVGYCLIETGFLIPAAILGLSYLPRRVAWFLTLVFACNAFWALNYNISDYWIYFIPCWLATVIAAAAGLEDLRNHPGWSKVPIAVLVSLVLLYGGLGARSVWSQTRRHPRTQLAEESLGLLREVDSQAVLISADYHQSQFLLYYLLGEGWQERGIYVVQHFSTEAIRGYLSGQPALRLPEQRLTVPLGLRVFAIGETHLEALQQAGLKTTAVRQSLYRVSL